MRTRKIFCVLIILLFIVSIGTVVFAKTKLKKLDYDNYVETSLYYLLPEDEYKSMYDFDSIAIHDSVDDLSNLLPYTDAILIVTLVDDPEFVGNGILNNCKIKKVLEGKGFREDQVIEIYDFVAWWKMSDTAYLNGSTPLNESNDYIVFIRKAPRPNKKDTYIYSSIPYGHIKISDSIDVLENYDAATITVKQAMNYQFIFGNNTNPTLVDLYKKNCEQLISKYK